MSPGTRLVDVPDKFLNQEKWTQVQGFASSKLEALCLLNAPYPDGAADFFWKGEGSASDARRCYRLGKSLVEECRSRFIAGGLVASGVTRNGVKTLIPRAFWTDLYPMFATDKIIGRTRQFTNIEVYESSTLNTTFESQLDECIAWMKKRKFEGASSKKALHGEALKHFEGRLTLRMFETSYKAVFNLGRGRPSK